MAPDQSPRAGADTPDNALLDEWRAPFATPPFARLRSADFGPALEAALRAHAAEITAIAADREAPSFDNTLAALERSGQALARVSAVFHLHCGANADDALLATEREMAPRLAAHWDAIEMNADLYARVEAVHAAARSAPLAPEAARVLERYRTRFRRAGAGLKAPARARLAAIGERLATLAAQFGQNVLADEKAWALVLDGEEDLAGLPDHVRAAAQEAAGERGLAGGHVVSLSRSSVEPFLTYSRRRDLREKLLAAFHKRGENAGESDNTRIIAEMARLRAEKARLLGHPTYAHYRLDDSMAKTPAAARALLDRVWEPARARAQLDRDAMQDIVRAEGGNFPLAACDWRFYAQKLRALRCDIAAGDIEPYLSLDNMIAAAFATASRLFGLSFEPRTDIAVWDDHVRVWDVRDADGGHVGLFFGDYFARPAKRGGAWMTTLRDQHRLDGAVSPLVVNVMNFSRARPGEPTLLSFDDARTLFHEFGHALHGLLSDVTYPCLSGTNVETDFVELPSQLFEHWIEAPEILREFARHYRSGEPMPEALVRKLVAARGFDEAFRCVEYIACAIVDLDLHSHPLAGERPLAALEAATLERIAMPPEIAMRHRLPHFTHIFSGDHYAAGYYSYMWSEVLDADAFRAFEEAGDVFDAPTARRLREAIYAAGGTRAPDEAYVAFRGRLPSADALLRKRGFAPLADANGSGGGATAGAA